MKTRLALLFLTLALMGLPAAAASPWRDVHVEVTYMFDVPGPFAFTATGQAVSAGLICPTGLESTGPITATPSPDGDQFVILSMVKHWECAGGGIDAYLVVTLDLVSGSTWGDWSILSATGTYAGIRGSGSLVGTRLATGDGIRDVWDGKLSVAPVLDVAIHVPTRLPAGPPTPFTASGGAVAKGLICASGVVSTGPVKWEPWPDSERYFTLSMIKYFVCSGGTFDVRLVVTLDNWSGSTVGTWQIIDSSGSCAGLKGHGTIVGIFDRDTNVVTDDYTGTMKR